MTTPVIPSLSSPMEAFHIRYRPFLIALVTVIVVILVVLWIWDSSEGSSETHFRGSALSDRSFWKIVAVLLIWVLIIFLLCHLLPTRSGAWFLLILGLFLLMFPFMLMMLFGGLIPGLLFAGILVTLILIIMNVCA